MPVRQQERAEHDLGDTDDDEAKEQWHRRRDAQALEGPFAVGRDPEEPPHLVGLGEVSAADHTGDPEPQADKKAEHACGSGHGRRIVTSRKPAT